MRKTAGIYRIRVDRGERAPLFYIGQAADLHVRSLDHFRRLRTGKHRCGRRLLQAFQKYGEDAFSFSAVLVCSKPMLTVYEQAVLDYHVQLYGRRRMLNVMLECVTSGVGLKHRPESIQRMKVAPKSPNSLQALKSPNRIIRLRESLAGKPKVHSAETIAKISAGLTGLKQSAEQIEKRRASLRGRKHSPEAIAKRVASRRKNAAMRRLNADANDEGRDAVSSSPHQDGRATESTRNC